MYINRLFKFCRRVNITKTIYWNFRLLPFKVAKHLPLFIGHNVEFIGVTRNSIIIETKNYTRGTIKIGISDFPQFPIKNVSTMIRLGAGSKIIFGNNIEIGKGCSVVGTYRGQIIFGNDIFMNMHSMIYSNKYIKIGNHVRIGWQSQIYDSNIHYMIDTSSGIIKPISNSIIISDNVWLANHVTIAPGAKIPPFTTVAAHSLVNRNFMEEHEIGGLLVGTPAIYKPIGKVRLLNGVIEHHIKSTLKDMQDNTDIAQFGYSLLPFDAQKNPLYRTQT